MTVPDSLKFSVKKWTVFILMCWSMAGVLFAVYSYHLVDESMLNLVHTKAEEAFNKDQSFRFWASKHGGVYVPINEFTPPNQYLEVPEREVATPAGKQLTLMNPAYMMRQLNETFGKLYGVEGHITSLKPLRPSNKPDKWEEQALKLFESGVQEVYEVVDVDGARFGRLMRPMPVKEGCLKCHAHQGYKVGDIRGGVSVSVPLAPFQGPARAQILQSTSTAGLLWFSGVAMILLGSHLLSKNLREREMLAKHLRIAMQVAENANSAKSVFLANMSHEIRTPLNGIAGMLQLVKSTSLDPEQTEYTNAAIESSDRLTQLLSDILDLSMVEAGVIELRKEPVSLSHVFGQIEKLFSVNSQQSDIELTFSLDKDLPSHVLGDPVRLQQIFINLIGNAVKFTKKGVIEVAAKRLPASENCTNRILFSVSDTGCGIADKQLAKMFEPFCQIDEGYNKSFQGAGLGLSICKRLIDLMHGAMSVDSEPDKGTAVYFSIPFKEAKKEEATVEVLEGETVLPDLGLRVLLAEDDRISQVVALRLMAKMGCEVVAVDNGKQAVEALRDAQFDIVVMDVQMPIMDGLEAVKAIRMGEAGDDKATTPVIAMTAYATAADGEKFIAQGMNGHVTKPVDIQKLQTALERYTA